MLLTSPLEEYSIKSFKENSSPAPSIAVSLNQQNKIIVRQKRNFSQSSTAVGLGDTTLLESPLRYELIINLYNISSRSPTYLPDN